MKHYSVLKKEVISFLNLKPDGVYIDGTLGYAGHASEILKKIPNGKLYAFDRDWEAIRYSQEFLASIGSNFELIHSDFANLKEELRKRNILKVDGILLDLGVSSPQIDTVSRGFSFMREEALDMRMDQTQEFDAKKLLATYSYSNLCEIFFQYGEESKSKAIASEIVKYREQEDIGKTNQLVDIILKAVGANYFYKKHPERNIFQAIRIEVNQELEALKKSDGKDLRNPKVIRPSMVVVAN